LIKSINYAPKLWGELQNNFNPDYALDFVMRIKNTKLEGTHGLFGRK